ncbi:MAG: protein kinase [Acidobacteriota bacterium]
MSEVATDATCPTCGTPLSRDRRSQGLCPGCILELALESPSLMEDLGSPNAAALDSDATWAFTAETPFVGEDVGQDDLGPSGATLAASQTIGGRYHVRSLLGRGGMGEVWRAFDLKLRVDVALKVVRRQLIGDSSALDLLRQEVRAAREVTSPNVCRVFDLIELDGQELVSMEYIDGITLFDILKARAPLDLAEAREIAAQFLAGLEAIHTAGLVHRDVKPENLMMTRSGRVVLMDFGIAKGLQEVASATIAGTPAYMSPEQSRGEDLDARADVFSAGVVLAEMIAPGGLKTPDARQRIWKGIRQDPPEVAKTPWVAVLKKSVATDRKLRYPTASALARALEEVTLRGGGDEDLDPYPGLSSFTEEDAEYFFGRELEIEEMWKKLHRPHLLALIGPSGAGKSSFLRAGLLSVIPTGWKAIIRTPGSAPFSTLARSLVPELAEDTEALQLLTTAARPDAADSGSVRGALYPEPARGTGALLHPTQSLSPRGRRPCAAVDAR